MANSTSQVKTCLSFTSFDVRYPFKDKEDFDRSKDVPFMIVNATFKIDRSFKYESGGTDYSWGQQIWNRAFTDSQEYRQVIVTDDPAKEEEWYMNRVLDIEKYFSEPYPGIKRTYQAQEPPWKYLEKFDTFWFRQWVAFSPVTVALVHELTHFHTFGELPSIYRSATESIVLKHLETLDSYWD